jgi:hypothetical protein
VLTGITITLLHKLLRPGQLIDHFGVVLANSQASNKDLFGIISLMVSKQETHLYFLRDEYFHFQTGFGTGCFVFNLSMDGGLLEREMVERCPLAAAAPHRQGGTRE